jgi:hypothetical protein
MASRPNVLGIFAAPEPSPADRIDRVERELEALRKLVA